MTIKSITTNKGTTFTVGEDGHADRGTVESITQTPKGYEITFTPAVYRRLIFLQSAVSTVV